MSYTVATPGGRARPATVTVASSLLYLCAAIEGISLALSALTLSPTLDAYRSVYKGDPNLDTMLTFAQGATIGAIVVAALFAVGTAVLGALLGRGKNPARIVTWVVAGIGVLCFGCGLGAGSVVSSMGGSAADPKATALQRQVQDAIPSWQSAVSTILTVVMLLALVAVIILLALPASNEFFRKEQEVWVPPTAPDLATFPPPLSVPQQSFPSAPESLPPAATPAPEPPVAQPPSAPPPSDPPANTPPSAP